MGKHTKVLSAITLLLAGLVVHAEDVDRKVYALEMRGKVVGYSEEIRGEAEYEGASVDLIRTTQFLKLSLLEMPMDQRTETASYFDPSKDRVVAIDLTTEVGAIKSRVHCTFMENSALCNIYVNDELARQKELAIADETVIPWGDEFLLSRAKSLAQRGIGSKTHISLFYLAAVDLTDAVLEYEGKKLINDQGKETQADSVLLTLAQGGTRIRYFFVNDISEIARAEFPDSEMVMFRADSVTADQLKRAEITDTLLAQVNLQIADIGSLSYMKTRVEIVAPGDKVDVHSLNVAGQKFTGTVENQIINGVFEVSQSRFSGEDAPLIGTDFSSDPALAKYAEPEPQIESNHPEVTALAAELSRGATTTWQVAVKTAEWVHENINYDIPGGGSALNTLRTKLAECGGHSRLHVALCRAAGVPARLVTGAMYTPAYGGSFGQHAWMEVYMGEDIGWIPIDATAGEVSYVDSGHIRLGESVAFRPRSMEVLDYAPKETRIPGVVGPRPAPYPIGEKVVFYFLLDDREIGTDTFLIERVDEYDGKTAFFIRSNLELTGLSTSGETILSRTGGPLYYSVKGQTSQFDYSIDCRFSGDMVEVTLKKGDVESVREINLPSNVMLFDNNNLGHFAMMLSRFDLAEETVFTIDAFHPASMSVLPLKVSIGNLEQITVRETVFQAYRIAIEILGQTLIMHVTEDGALIRDSEQGGRLVIEYEESA